MRALAGVVTCLMVVAPVVPAAAQVPPGLMQWLDVETAGGETFGMTPLLMPNGAKTSISVVHGAGITGLYELQRVGEATGAVARTAPGWIAFASDRGGRERVHVMRSDGTEMQAIGPDDARTAWPDFSPDGRHIAFEYGEGGAVDIVVMALDGSFITNITKGGSQCGKPDWAPDGSQILFSSGVEGTQDLYVARPDGSQIAPLLVYAGSDEVDPVWSPDGTRVAFRSTSEGRGDIFVCNADGSNPTNMTRHPGPDYDPEWSPDGSQIAWTSERDGNFEIYVMNADGSDPQRLTDDRAWDSRPAWSPDGTQIAFDSDRGGRWNIWAMDADGGNPHKITDDRETDHCPCWTGASGAETTTTPTTAPADVFRTIIGAPGSDDGSDPTLGIARPMVIACHGAGGLKRVVAVASNAQPGNMTVTPLQPLSDKLVAVVIGGGSMAGVIEDRSRGLFPWGFAAGGADSMIVLLHAKTGRVKTVIGVTGDDAGVESADGRLVVRGAIVSAVDRRDASLNYAATQLAEVVVQSTTGEIAMVR